VAHALAMTWSFCVWHIADSQHQVAPEFRNSIIQDYLVFMLKLGWQPSEIFLGPVEGNAEGLDVWRDLFLSELQARFMGGGSTKQNALKNAFESLDQGKSYVYEGRTWLEKELFG
jgi:hypothetical protein